MGSDTTAGQIKTGDNNIRQGALEAVASPDTSNSKVYKLSDYSWSEFSDLSTGISTSNFNNNYTVPTLRLHAFQPYRRAYIETLAPLLGFAAVKGLLGKVISSGAARYLNPDKLADALKDGKSGQEAIDIANSGTKNLVSDVKDVGIDIAKNAAQLFFQHALMDTKEASSAAIEKGIEYLQALFKYGIWLQSYEVPFFSDVYQKVDGNAGWSTGGIENIGESTSRLGKFLSEGFNVNIPLQPTWTKPASKEESDQVTTAFYLINSTYDNFRKNYVFMNSLMAHCYWTQLDYYMQSPNVFRAAVPGRFNYLWATLGMEVKIEGKMRPVSPFNGSIPNVNMIPDAYKVTLTINSLCPNNYNMFLNFLNTSYKYVSDTPTSTRLDALHAAANPATASGGLAKNITTGIVNGAFEVIL